MRWKIVPFVGIGDVRLNMSISQVANVLGQKINFTTPLEDGSFNEHREGSVPVCNYMNDHLRSIDVYSDNYDIELDDLFLFQDDLTRIIEYLESIAGAPSIAFGICLFKTIGISLGKWINPHTYEIRERPPREQDLRSVSISSKGAFFDMFPDQNIRSLKFL